MVHEFGGPRLPFLAAIRIYMVANLGRYVPGKVLQLVGLTWLARREGVPGPVALGAAVIGHAIALIGAGCIGAGTLLNAPPPWNRLGWVLLGMGFVLVVVTSVPRTAVILQRFWLRLARVDEQDLALARGLRGFGARWTMRYGLNWTLYALGFWLFAVGLGGQLSVWDAAPAFAAAYVAGYLALFAPAGIGIREASLVVFLGASVGPEPALALAVAARLWITLLEVVPAALLAARTPLSIASSPSDD
jgi:uncharacterized membrane protein YbhN (UPF0104 family)